MLNTRVPNASKLMLHAEIIFTFSAMIQMFEAPCISYIQYTKYK